MKNGIIFLIFLIFLILSLPVRAENFTDEQALLHYSVNGKSDSIEEYLKKGVNPNCRDTEQTFEGETPLMKTVLGNDLKNTKLLLKYKADINAVDERGESALLVAAHLGYEQMVEYLTERGADINIQSKTGVTPLMVAANKGHLEIVEYLLKKGAKVKPLNSGYTIVMAAAKYEPEIIELFLKKGVDPNARTKSGNTALMEAAVARNMKSIRILLEYNADPTLKNKQEEDYSSSSCSLPNSSSVSTP